MRSTSMLIALVMLFVVLIVGTAPSEVIAQADRTTAEQEPFSIGNRDAPHVEQTQAFVKAFLGALRGDHRDDPERDAHTFRSRIDPVYLDKHGLSEGGLPMRTIEFVGMVVIQVADDGQTVLCVVERGDRSRFSVVFRVVQRESELYVQPFAEPDAESGYFHPWILTNDHAG